MTTLAEKCKAAGLSSAAELTRITGTSKETLTNWLKDKPQLFEVVLRGARSSLGLNQSKIKDDFDKSKSEYIDYLYLKDDYAKLQEKYNILQKTKQPEQQWCFSQEDLQEQAKLIERLTAENQRLSAELQVLQRNNKKYDIDSMDKVKLYQALEQYRLSKNSKPLSCDCLTAKGGHCKKPYEPQNSLDVVFSVELCNFHKSSIDK